MPEKMRIDRGADSKIYYTYNSDKQGTFVFRKDEILHIVGLGFDGLVGYSPIAMAKNAIGLSIAAEEYGSSFFLKQRYTKRSFGTSGSFERAGKSS